MTPPVELKIPVPWGHVAAVSYGRPQSKPVLMVHGNQDNAGSFIRLIHLLPKTYHYISIDLPGHGFSSHFPQGMNLDFFNYLLTIHYILDELNWQNCLYVGHSFGGQLGIMYSIFYPGRLEKIITIDALMTRAYSPTEAFKRLKTVQETTLFSLKKKETNFYTKEEILDAVMNKRQFSLNKEAAEALIVRAVTKVGDKYKYNRDVRMRAHVGLYFNEEQNIEFMKNLNTPVLFLIASDSWFGLLKKNHIAEMYKETFSAYVTSITVEGNHDVHNNNPENVAPHVISFFNDEGHNTRSKL